MSNTEGMTGPSPGEPRTTPCMWTTIVTMPYLVDAVSFKATRHQIVLDNGGFNPFGTKGSYRSFSHFSTPETSL